jgi:predicted amino acid-binding ACT domain protein
LTKTAEVGTMSKLGGGTSGYFGDLRPRGVKISVGGESSGPAHFMELFDTVTDVVSQGCYDEETEVLTQNGWMYFKDLKNTNIKVAQVEDDESISFVDFSSYFEYDVNEDMILFKDSKNINLLVTKNHNMVYKQEKKTISYKDGVKSYSRTVKDKFYSNTAVLCPMHRDVKYLHSAYLPSGKRLSDFERILIAIQADGNIVKNASNSVKFRFSKTRKSDRLKYLLDSVGIEYSYSYYDSDDTHNIYVNFGDRKVFKTFDWVNISSLSYDWCQDFLLEILEWDGSKSSEYSGSYSSVVESNVDVVQCVAACCGYKSYKTTDLREEHDNRSTIYKLYISNGNYFGVEKLKKESESGNLSDSDIIKKVKETLKQNSDILIMGEDGSKIHYSYATCCNPIPGDEVFGFITLNEGVKIHRLNCPNAVNLMSKYSYRIVKTKWNQSKEISFLTGFKINGIDDLGLVNKMTKIISEHHNINIKSISVESEEGIFEGIVKLYVMDIEQLEELIQNLKKLDGVINIKRLEVE